MTDEQMSFIESVTDILSKFGIYGDVSSWIACQMSLESNFGKSTLSKYHSNITGMRVSHIRITTSRITVGSGFAKYVNQYECIVDYVLWLQFNHFSQAVLNDLKSFVRKMELYHYCSDVGYIESINKLFNSLKS